MASQITFHWYNVVTWYIVIALIIGVIWGHVTCSHASRVITTNVGSSYNCKMSTGVNHLKYWNTTTKTRLILDNIFYGCIQVYFFTLSDIRQNHHLLQLQVFFYSKSYENMYHAVEIFIIEIPIIYEITVKRL